MAKYRNKNTDELVEAEVLDADQGVVVDADGNSSVQFAAGNVVLLYPDGEIRVAHPTAFEAEWVEV
jgi:hypothetical protein